MNGLARYAVFSLEHPHLADALDVLVSVAVLLTAAVLMAALLRRTAAGVRHLIWTSAVLGSLALPFLRWKGGSGAGSQWMGAGAPSGVSLPTVVVGLWIGGSLLLALRALTAQRALRGLLARTRPLTDPNWLRCLAEAGGDGVQLHASGEVGSPFVAGAFRPRIVVPESMLKTAGPERRAILVHEMAHIRRHDVAIGLLAVVARILYWPMPMIWLAVRGIELEAERASDAAAVASGVDRPRYARQLMDLAPGRLGIGGAVAPGIGHSQMYRRIEAICGTRPPPVPRTATLLCTAALAVVCVLGVSRIELPRADLGFISESGSEPLLLHGNADVTRLFIHRGELGG